MTHSPATVTQSGATVRVTRHFAAPRALVWQAYTTPALLQRWLLGPPGWTMPVCEMDLRPGGAYRWRWRADVDGQEFGFEGVFTLVDAPNRLAHTESFDPGNGAGVMGQSGVTLSFSETETGTVVVTDITYDSPETLATVLATGMTDGMEASYTHLDRILANA